LLQDLLQDLLRELLLELFQELLKLPRVAKRVTGHMRCSAHVVRVTLPKVKVQGMMEKAMVPKEE
jgi:hypothetical protein